LIFHFEAQGITHEAMKNLANSMDILAGQLNRLKQVSKSNEVGATIIESPRMMEEVVDFLNSEVARKLDAYVSIHLRWILH